MSVTVKICGLTNPGDARAAVEAGADYLGFVFHPASPRYVGLTAGSWIRLVEGSPTVGVFRDQDPDLVGQVREEAGLDLVQLHGRETPELCAELGGRGRVIKAIPVNETVDWGLVTAFGQAAHVLFDTASPGDPPTRISVGKRPVAVAGALTSAGSGDVVYVANAGDGTISLLDALTGEVVSSPAVKSLGAETPGAITASSVSIEKSNRTITATIQLDGGKLDKRGLVVKDKAISDGKATIELWQGSISAQVDKETAEGLSVQVKEETGRQQGEREGPDHREILFAPLRVSRPKFVMSYTVFTITDDGRSRRGDQSCYTLSMAPMEGS